MKMTVVTLLLCVLAGASADLHEPAQLEKYGKQMKTYRLEVPGKNPITIIETAPDELEKKWEDKHDLYKDKDDIEIRNLMTHIVHDVNENVPRCYGPSCQQGFDDKDGPQKEVDDLLIEYDKLKDIRDFPMDRLQAISMLAAKLKKDKLKADRYSSMSDNNSDDDNNDRRVYTSWNRLKVKQHKHPYDDKDGWVSLEPVAWSTSKISKWKPNVKKPKPSYSWNDDTDRFSDDDDDYASNSYQGMGYGNSGNSYQAGSSYNYGQKKPAVMTRPGYINNKLHVSVSQDYDTELPKPTWMKPQQNLYTASYPSSWSPDESRRPQKPSCESHDNYPNDDSMYYGTSDSVVTDNRPSHFPYEYEALHQPSHRPMKRPTQVVYSGPPESEDDRSSRPPYGDGQWVLLSTTKGYRNKKRQRSLNLDASDHAENPNSYKSMTSHQAVALTVLPVDNAHTNMTTSHGGMLEVEKSFKTVEESKRDLDKDRDSHETSVSESQPKPVVNKNRVVRKQIVSSMSSSPDSGTLLAAVGAGMVPATMAMVVPMMLGRRRRRDVNSWQPQHDIHLDHLLYKYE